MVKKRKKAEMQVFIHTEVSEPLDENGPALESTSAVQPDGVVSLEAVKNRLDESKDKSDDSEFKLPSEILDRRRTPNRATKVLI